MKTELPNLYQWDGGQIIPDAWSFGYVTGQDHDLICVKPNLSDKIKTEIAKNLVEHTGLNAISAFWAKRLLILIDQNLWGR